MFALRTPSSWSGCRLSIDLLNDSGIICKFLYKGTSLKYPSCERKNTNYFEHFKMHIFALLILSHVI